MLSFWIFSSSFFSSLIFCSQFFSFNFSLKIFLMTEFHVAALTRRLPRSDVGTKLTTIKKKNESQASRKKNCERLCILFAALLSQPVVLRSTTIFLHRGDESEENFHSPYTHTHPQKCEKLAIFVEFSRLPARLWHFFGTLASSLHTFSLIKD